MQLRLDPSQPEKGGTFGVKFSSAEGTTAGEVQGRPVNVEYYPITFGTLTSDDGDTSVMYYSLDEGETWSELDLNSEWGISYRRIYRCHSGYNGSIRNNKYVRYFVFKRTTGNTCYFVYSDDYGQTWNLSEALSFNTNYDNIGSGDSSHDGLTCVYGTYQGDYYVTQDGFANAGLGTEDLTFVSMSKDAEYMYAGHWNTLGQVYRSTNKGDNWSVVDVNYPNSRPKFITDVDDTGQYVFVASWTSVSNGRGCFLSSDYGVNWTTLVADSVKSSGGMSFTGQYIAYHSYSTNTVNISSDYGQNFTSYTLTGHSSGDNCLIYMNRTTGKLIVRSYTGSSTWFYWEPGETSLTNWGNIIPGGETFRSATLTFNNYFVFNTRVGGSSGKIYKSDSAITFGNTPTFTSKKTTHYNVHQASSY